MSWPAISHLEFLECFFSNLLTLIYVRVRLKIQPNLVYLHCLFGGAPTLIFLFNPLWSHYASATLALPHRLWNFSHEYIFHCVHVEFFLGGCSSFHHFLRLHTYIVYMDSGISEYLKPMFKGLKSAMGLGLFLKIFLPYSWYIIGWLFSVKLQNQKVIGTKMKKRPCSTYHVLNPLFGWFQVVNLNS